MDAKSDRGVRVARAGVLEADRQDELDEVGPAVEGKALVQERCEAPRCAVDVERHPHTSRPCVAEAAQHAGMNRQADVGGTTLLRIDAGYHLEIERVLFGGL